MRTGDLHASSRSTTGRAPILEETPGTTTTRRPPLRWSLTSLAAFFLLLTAAPARVTQAPRDQRPDGPDAARVEKAIAVLREARQVSPELPWATAIRDLVEIGKPAVPALIHELDQTTEQVPLRFLGFTLRAIGDPRAVPALIRAIPRTLIPPRSDYGLLLNDAELLTFMQEHDLNAGKGGTYFDLGRPIREITGALHTLTGQRFNEDELNFVALGGGVTQRRIQRMLFHELAASWAAWWEENARRFTDDPAYAKVDLPPPTEVPAPPGGDPLFPTGLLVKASEGWANVILGPPEDLKYYATFQDLDTGRNIPWRDDLPALAEARNADVADWATRTGYDLRGIAFTPPGADRPFYALRPLGLRAWRLDVGAYDTIESDLQTGKIPDLSRPVGDLLVAVDPTNGAYHADEKATFLFITREGSTGVLRVTGQVTELFGKEDVGRPADPNAKRGFYRGMQFEYKLLYEAVGEASPQPEGVR